MNDKKYDLFMCAGCGYPIQLSSVNQFKVVYNVDKGGFISADEEVNLLTDSIKKYLKFVNHISNCKPYASIRRDNRFIPDKLMVHLNWFDKLIDKYPQIMELFDKIQDE